MPHVIVEYSKNIISKYPPQDLLGDIHECLRENGAPIERVKTRGISLEDYIVGEGDTDASMIHITILLLEGRSTEVKKGLCDSVHALVRSNAQNYGLDNCAVTMEIRDMAADTYYK